MKYIIIALLCGIPIISAAQETIDSRFGAAADFIMAIHSADFHALPGVPNCCPQFNKGAGYGFSISGLYEHSLGSAISGNVRLGYTFFNGTLEATETTTIGVNGLPTRGVFLHSVKADFGMLTAEGMLGYSPITALGTYWGLGSGYVLQNHYDQKEILQEPSSAGTFENGRRARNESSGELSELNRIQAWATAAVVYEVPFGTNAVWTMRPEIIVRLGLTNLVNGLQWKVNMVMAGVSLMYLPSNVSTSPDENLPPRPPQLVVDVDAAGINPPDNKEEPIVRLRVEEFSRTRLQPLLNHIFFDEASAAIPARYHQLTKDQAEHLPRSSMYDTNALETYHNVLNIIGMRLRELPNAKIKIVGCNTNAGMESGDTSLSRLRAEAVRHYLQQVWNIAPERLRVDIRNLPEKPSNIADSDGVEENRRVEISSNAPEILAPVETRDTLRTATPSLMRFRTRIYAEAGVKDSRINVRQSEDSLVTLTRNGKPPSFQDWKIDPNEVRTSQPLTYELTVDDSAAQHLATKKKQLPVELLTISGKRADSTANDKEYFRSQLILFDFGDSSLTYQQMGILDHVKRNIDSTTMEVTITGHTDRIGESSVNLELSKRRADKVGEAIKNSIPEGIEVHPQGTGKDAPLYDNSSPEGRFYNRTVVITVVNRKLAGR